MDNTYIQVFNTLIDQANEMGLSASQLLILAKIKEFERNNCKCYMTDEQLAYISLQSARNVARDLKKLEEVGLLQRSTETIIERGSTKKKRTLTTCQKISDDLSKNP